MTRVGFILKPDKSEAGPLLPELVEIVNDLGAKAHVLIEDGVSHPKAAPLCEAEIGQAIDLAIVVGGDGTMLRANELVAAHDIPVLGINVGRLGFMTAFSPSRAREHITAAIAGDLPISERVRLRIHHISAAGPPASYDALNEAVIHQGAKARLIDLHAQLDGERISTYRADGLIVSTPTGSTAYNLAAGGPIIVPGHEAMAITPICAHGLTSRPLVVPSKATVSIELHGVTSSVVLSVDGQWARPFMPGDRVDISEADKPFRLFKSAKSDFDILREKLSWGVLQTS